MKKYKVFYGPEQSGKTRAAREYAAGKKTSWVRFKYPNHIHLPDFIKADPDTELFIFDDVPLNMLRAVMNFCLDPITVNCKGKDSFILHDHEIIITVSGETNEMPTEKWNLDRFEFIQFLSTGKSDENSHPTSCFTPPAPPKQFFYFSFKVNKKKIKGKVDAHNHREAWQKVLLAVDTLEKLGGLSVTDVTIPPQPQKPIDFSQLVNQ